MAFVSFALKVKLHPRILSGGKQYYFYLGRLLSFSEFSPGSQPAFNKVAEDSLKSCSGPVTAMTLLQN